MKVEQSDSTCQKTRLLAPICKNVEFCVFSQKKDHGCLFIRWLLLVFFFFFFSWVTVSNQWSYKIGRGLFQLRLKVLVLFICDQKYWRATSLPPTPLFPQRTSDQNFEISIWFSIVERPSNYAFGDDITP